MSDKNVDNSGIHLAPITQNHVDSPEKSPRKQLLQFSQNFPKVDHRASFKLFGSIGCCGTREFGTMIFGILMILGAIFQQFKHITSFKEKLTYNYSVMSGQKETSDYLFVFVFAVLPMSVMISIPSLSICSYLTLIFAVIKKKVDLYPSSICFAWFFAWFLFVDICKEVNCLRHYGFDCYNGDRSLLGIKPELNLTDVTIQGLDNSTVFDPESLKTEFLESTTMKPNLDVSSIEQYQNFDNPIAIFTNDSSGNFTGSGPNFGEGFGLSIHRSLQMSLSIT